LVDPRDVIVEVETDSFFFEHGARRGHCFHPPPVYQQEPRAVIYRVCLTERSRPFRSAESERIVAVRGSRYGRRAEGWRGGTRPCFPGGASVAPPAAFHGGVSAKSRWRSSSTPSGPSPAS